MKSLILMRIIGLLVCLIMCSCSTTLTGRPTYDASTYGTSALLDMVSSTQSSAGDAEAAAKELAKRKMTAADGAKLLSALQIQPHRKARVALLKTITTQGMTCLYGGLVTYSSAAPDAETAIETATTVVSLAPNEEAVFEYSKATLLTAKFSEVRSRAARLIVSNFPDRAEPIFIQALGQEKSASAATYMCEYLAQKGSSSSFTILNSIANDVARTFEADSYLGTKTTSETVRGAAVRGAERLR